MDFYLNAHQYETNPATSWRVALATSNTSRVLRRHGVSHSNIEFDPSPATSWRVALAPQTRSEPCDDMACRTRNRDVAKARWRHARHQARWTWAGPGFTIISVTRGETVPRRHNDERARLERVRAAEIVIASMRTIGKSGHGQRWAQLVSRAASRLVARPRGLGYGIGRTFPIGEPAELAPPRSAMGLVHLHCPGGPGDV